MKIYHGLALNRKIQQYKDIDVYYINMRTSFICIMCYSFFTRNILITSEYIKNINKPACKTCIHFKPASSTKYDSYISRCQLFGVKDIITDEITYDYASTCRSDDSKCGEKGVHYVKDTKFELKKLKHNLFDDAPIIIVCALCFLYIILVIQITGGVYM